jgi:hypothetical protein
MQTVKLKVKNAGQAKTLVVVHFEKSKDFKNI